MTMAKPTLLLAVFAAAAVLLGGCAAAPEQQPTQGSPTQSAAAPSGDVLADAGLESLSAEAIVDRLDRVRVAERSTALMASVRQDELILSDARGEVVLPMPTDRSYVSVAPFVSQTHECHFHSLTTCRGELAGERVHVTITDGATGEVLVVESTQTYDNGFVGYWLPRGASGTIRIEGAAGVGTAEFSTGAGEPTCITTLQLA